ncbi:MAG: Peptidoglycan-binding domain 1 protein [Clostridiales bacterium]|nr:Peptidoglycan-binding domain 1 protein [Clostridiales bacterium]
MKKVYFCFILTLILILSACSKVKMPKTDEILEPIVSETIDTDGSSAVDNSDEVNDPKDEELNPVDTNTVDVIDDNDDDDIDDDQGDTISQDTTEEVFKTRVAISTTGKEVVLQIPNTTKIIISNNNGIKVDKVEVANLEKLMNSFDSNVSFFYIDLKTGLTMEARADIKYASASVIKAPFVKSVLESGADLNEKIAIKKQDYHGGSGTLQYQPVGTLYTVKDLIKYTIEDSDNVAYNMLCRRFGFDQFSSNAIKLGINADQAANLKFGHLSSRDAARNHLQ